MKHDQLQLQFTSFFLSISIKPFRRRLALHVVRLKHRLIKRNNNKYLLPNNIESIRLLTLKNRTLACHANSHPIFSLFILKRVKRKQ